MTKKEVVHGLSIDTKIDDLELLYGQILSEFSLILRQRLNE